MHELVTINDKGQAVTTSKKVADYFGKTHFHVMRDIRKLEIPKEFSESNFGYTSYVDEMNRKQPAYQMTRDGFTILVMGFTGPEAMKFKLEYIEAFNRMEGQLRDISKMSRKDIALMIIEQEEALERAAFEKEELKTQIGDATNWKCVRAIPWLKEKFHIPNYSKIGKDLTRLSQELDYEVKLIEDSKWGKVNAYHVDVIDKYHQLLEHPDIGLFY